MELCITFLVPFLLCFSILSTQYKIKIFFSESGLENPRIEVQGFSDPFFLAKIKSKFLVYSVSFVLKLVHCDWHKRDSSSLLQRHTLQADEQQGRKKGHELSINSFCLLCMQEKATKY